MRYVTIALLCIFLCGWWGSCRKAIAEKPPLPPTPSVLVEPPKAPKADKDGSIDPLEQAMYDIQRFSEAAAQATARYEVLKKQRDEELLSEQIAWITGICLILAAVAGVAAFIVPIGKKYVVGAAVGFAAIAACAQAFHAAVPYLPWIGGALVLGGGLWVSINWRKLGDTVKAASDHGDRLEDWLTTDLIEKLPPDLRAAAEKLILDVKDESQKQATRLGVHSNLQFLRGKVPTLWQRLFPD